MTVLPTDPRTGITALGIINGRVRWPIAGGSEPAPEAPVEPAPEEPAAPVEPEEDKTDWKAESRKWEQRAKENREKARKLDEVEQANQTELEKAQKAAEANAQRAQAATVRAVTAEAKVLAADGFANPAVAVQLLGDLTRFVGDDGEIDDKALGKELADLLKREPYLAKTEPKPEPTRPGATRPTESLRPGAAPTEPERASNLYDAVGAWATQQT